MIMLIFNILKCNIHLTYGEMSYMCIKPLGIFGKVSMGMSSKNCYHVGGNGEYSPDMVRANMMNSSNSSTNHAGGCTVFMQLQV